MNILKKLTIKIIILMFLISAFSLYPSNFSMTMQNTGLGMVNTIALSSDGTIFAITYPYSDNIYIWNIYGKLIHIIKTEIGSSPGSITISNDNKYIAYIANYQTIYIAELDTGKKINITGEASSFKNVLFYSIHFASDNLLYTGYNSTKVLDIKETINNSQYEKLLKTGYDSQVIKSIKESYQLDDKTNNYNLVEKNEHFSNLLTAYSMAGFNISLTTPELLEKVDEYNLTTGKKKNIFTGTGKSTGYISMIIPNLMKNELLLYHIDGSLIRLLANNGMVLSQSNVDTNMYYNNTIKYSKDGRFFGWVCSNGIRVLNANNVFAVNRSTQITAGDIDIENQRTIELSMEYDENKNLSNTIYIKDFNRNVLKKLCKPEKDGYIIKITPDGKRTIYGMSNGVISIINNETGDIVYLLSDDKGEWISYTSDGYWDGSKNAGTLISMTSGLDVYAIDQFAARYNRPDILMERIGIENKNLIDYYNFLYERRLKRMKLSNDFSNKTPPQSEILSIDRNDKSANVKFSLKSENLLITSYNIYVNDTPIYGATGYEISTKEITLTEKVELTSGNNKIEISCINSEGIESYRAVGYMNYDLNPKGDLYYIGFGVSKYKDSSINLQYADKDVTDLENLFKSMKSSYNIINTKSYVNDKCTKDVFNEAKKLLEKSKPDDTVIIFIAGHGIYDVEKDSTYYYLTYEAEPDNLKNTAADFLTIENLFQGIPARNKVFLMDTCESGEEKESLFTAFQNELKPNVKARSLKISNKNKTVKNTFLNDIRSYLIEKDRYIYNDLIRRSGAVVFSSSQGGEFSYEDDELKNGYFTYSILQAFKNNNADSNNNGIISINELRQYVTNNVSKLSNGLQNPAIDRDNLYQKIEFRTIK